jgi:hypothetical protein
MRIASILQEQNLTGQIFAVTNITAAARSSLRWTKDSGWFRLCRIEPGPHSKRLIAPLSACQVRTSRVYQTETTTLGAVIVDLIVQREVHADCRFDLHGCHAPSEACTPFVLQQRGATDPAHSSGLSHPLTEGCTANAGRAVGPER